MSSPPTGAQSDSKFASTFSTESGSGSSSSERRHSRSDSLSRPSLPQPQSAAAPDALPARVYHNIWRNTPNGSSSSLHSLRDLAQTLIERGGGGASSSMAREVGSISSLGEMADPLTELRRPASFRELAVAKEVVVVERWAAARWQLVMWFCCSCVVIVISFWWFGLGVVVGCIGLVGAVTGLRHDHNKHPILRPIKAAQLFGSLSALGSAACLILFAYLWSNLLLTGAGRDEAPSIRVMIPAVACCFACYAIVSIQAAHTATGLIAQLAPTRYLPQSVIMPAENVETHLTNLDAGDNHEL